MVHYIQQRLESSIVVVPPLVCGVHEQTIFADENACQVHRLINTVGRSVRLETIDADFRRRVQVPTRFSPKRLNVAVVALCFSAEELVSTFGGRNVKVYARLRRRGRNRKLIEM